MIKYFEQAVIKRAETQIKYKRLFAWFLLFSTMLSILDLCVKFYKLWNEHNKKVLTDKIQKEMHNVHRK